ncbi:MAG: hypothetical protein NZM06_05755 [Chloroherpetonaceae bacterium]|nr:hypothetical protein [Chloroherpetonaceae bacterium]MDW8436857.1 hypothetical protein [Chloroherpetonaceae bacterium]
MSDIRGGVITQVLYSIGIATETGLNGVSKAIGETAEATKKGIENVSGSIARSIEKVTDALVGKKP